MPGPISSYLLKPRRDLATACRDLNAAQKRKNAPCGPCPAVNVCGAAAPREEPVETPLPAAVPRNRTASQHDD